MPELPEVEVVRAGLAPLVTGASVLSVSVTDLRSVRRFPGGASIFVDRLLDSRILGASRRGKFLWFPLGDAAAAPLGEALVMHLGMSGQALLLAPGAEPPRHERVRLVVAFPSAAASTIVFNDQRVFGYLSIEEMRGGVPENVAHIARDPLDPAFDDDAFVASTRRTSRAIKRMLLDQTAVSGIGNIYADESLWRARIHPETPGAALSSQAVRRLLTAIRETLRDALTEGGTSFDEQYKNVNGASGYFDRHLNAYGRAGEPCPRCGRPIRRVRFMNRSSHFCPRCQRGG